MKKISQKERMQQDIITWFQATWVMFLFVCLSNIFWYIGYLHKNQQVQDLNQLVLKWESVYDIEHSFSVQNRKDFLEMQDYAWKLEHKLAKCKGVK